MLGKVGVEKVVRKTDEKSAGKESLKVLRGKLAISRLHTKANSDPFESVPGLLWEKRDASIKDISGAVVFEQNGVEVPNTWSATATNIVVSKYFRGPLNSKERENSVRQLIHRVAHTISNWGQASKYFTTQSDAKAFYDELVHLLLSQRAAFNSPVWFNVGVEPHPQCSACFINSVEDSMPSIFDLAKTEAMLFKFGSGTGTNFSAIRGSDETLKGGGSASGPLSFMKGFDAFAGVIKSGGKTRRAAKMVILNVDHPDIEAFIASKTEEEKKAWALIDAGYDAGFNVPGGAYDSIQFQNANHSVRVTDEFMQAVENDGLFDLKAVKDGKAVKQVRARDIWRKIATSAWLCGDPGLQFDGKINEFHTCKNTDRIYASNPCSEYMFLDDSACNLASINLIKYRQEGGGFDVDGFKHAVSIMLLAQEIMVDHASYPTEKIEKNSHKFRPLGLGYANLGALLMAAGLPYDSDEGRALAAGLTSLMGGEAYAVSAKIAKSRGAFAGYVENKRSFLDVMRKHRNAAHAISDSVLGRNLRKVIRASCASWDEVERLGSAYGFKNAQVTVLAPTGTIGFMMDCDTTGIEPDIALVKYKNLVGGGMMKIVNKTVPEALQALGYTHQQKAEILAHIESEDTIEGAPHLKETDLPVFDCAFKAAKGNRCIVPMGHIKMMSAVQPFLSGAISKTVNMPPETTVEEIEAIHLEAYKRDLKAVAIYRDGCKRSQPLNTKKEETDDKASGPILPVKGYEPTSIEDLIQMAKKMGDSKAIGQAFGKELGMVVRRRLPDERQAVTHKFSIGGHKGYITVGLFEDGTPGELFCTMAKEGSTISGLMDAFATAISLSMQYGVPLEVLVEKFSHTRFEPSGFTGNKAIPLAKSVTDYIFRWLKARFLKDSEGEASVETELSPETTFQTKQKALYVGQSDAPACQCCGSIMVRNGACYKCVNCGSTSGCS